MRKAIPYIEFAYFWVVSKLQRIYKRREDVNIPVMLNLPLYAIELAKSEAKRKGLTIDQMINFILKEKIKELDQ